ncbi:unnamed protein product [Mycena citricolor]|uniref:Uncharacterized protein n=1 Tax=Mycena citricolor TaxID=2018698 RepID=A0AAD2K1A8_9AGAR|nr:unnamed protein product [Mycena citricolor]
MPRMTKRARQPTPLSNVTNFHDIELEESSRMMVEDECSAMYGIDGTGPTTPPRRPPGIYSKDPERVEQPEFATIEVEEMEDVDEEPKRTTPEPINLLYRHFHKQLKRSTDTRRVISKLLRQGAQDDAFTEPIATVTRMLGVDAYCGEETWGERVGDLLSDVFTAYWHAEGPWFAEEWEAAVDPDGQAEKGAYRRSRGINLARLTGAFLAEGLPARVIPALQLLLAAPPARFRLAAIHQIVFCAAHAAHAPEIRAVLVGKDGLAALESVRDWDLEIGSPRKRRVQRRFVWGWDEWSQLLVLDVFRMLGEPESTTAVSF